MLSQNRLSSVTNAARVLKSFTHKHPVKYVTELAEELDISTSTVSRIVLTLKEQGFLEKDTFSSGYMLGEEFLNLGGIYVTSTQVFREVSPVVSDIVTETGESVHISILRGFEIVYMHKGISPYYSDIESHIGARQPAYATSSGKILLAGKDDTYIEEMFKEGIQTYTDKTITDLNDFLSEIKKIRSDGYATSIGEINEDNYSIAVPVWNEKKEIVCAISLIGPIQRLSKRNIERNIQTMLLASEEATERMMFADDFY